MAHIKDATGGFPADRKGLRDQLIQEFTAGKTFAKLLGLIGQGVIGKGSQAGLETVDFFDDRPERFDLTIVLAAENCVSMSFHNGTTGMSHYQRSIQQL